MEPAFRHSRRVVEAAEIDHSEKEHALVRVPLGLFLFLSLAPKPDGHDHPALFYLVPAHARVPCPDPGALVPCVHVRADRARTRGLAGVLAPVQRLLVGPVLGSRTPMMSLHLNPAHVLAHEKHSWHGQLGFPSLPSIQTQMRDRKALLRQRGERK